MKRHFFLLLLSLFAAGSACAQQQDFLTFRTASGAEKSLPAVGLKITFEGGRLIAVNGAEQATFALTELKSMFFASTPTGIAAPGASAGWSVSIAGGRLQTDAPAGTPVRVFSADGREVQPAGLGKGLYIVRIGDKTYKVMAQ